MCRPKGAGTLSGNDLPECRLLVTIQRIHLLYLRRRNDGFHVFLSEGNHRYYGGSIVTVAGQLTQKTLRTLRG